MCLSIQLLVNRLRCFIAAIVRDSNFASSRLKSLLTIELFMWTINNSTNTNAEKLYFSLLSYPDRINKITRSFYLLFQCGLNPIHNTTIADRHFGKQYNLLDLNSKHHISVTMYSTDASSYGPIVRNLCVRPNIFLSRLSII